MLGDNDDFVFIGWKFIEMNKDIVLNGNIDTDLGQEYMPIIVHKNITLNEDIYNANNNNNFNDSELRKSRMGYVVDGPFSSLSNVLDLRNIVSGSISIILLNKLMQLPNIRGLNLYNFAYMNLNISRGSMLMDDTSPVKFRYDPDDDVVENPRQWYDRNEQLITALELKYPGLFKKIFVGPNDAIAAAGKASFTKHGKSKRRRNKHSKTKKRL
jgi:hypothetical protein